MHGAISNAQTLILFGRSASLYCHVRRACIHQVQWAVCCQSAARGPNSNCRITQICEATVKLTQGVSVSAAVVHTALCTCLAKTVATPLGCPVGELQYPPEAICSPCSGAEPSLCLAGTFGCPMLAATKGRVNTTAAPTLQAPLGSGPWSSCLAPTQWYKLGW